MRASSETLNRRLALSAVCKDQQESRAGQGLETAGCGFVKCTYYEYQSLQQHRSVLPAIARLSSYIWEWDLYVRRTVRQSSAITISVAQQCRQASLNRYVLHKWVKATYGLVMLCRCIMLLQFVAVHWDAGLRRCYCRCVTVTASAVQFSGFPCTWVLSIAAFYTLHA